MDASPLLNEIQNGIQAALGNHLIGLYLYGSLVWGDFDAEISDIDLLAVTVKDIDEQEFARLDRMQNELADLHPEWQDRIEIAYLGLDALRTFRTQRSPIAVISPGEPFHIKDAGEDWLINWYIIQEKGVTLYGPPFRELVEPITKDEFLAGVKRQAGEWRDWIVHTKDSRPYQGYAILTMCRALYAVRNCEQVSKRQAALWAMKELPQWAELIQNALQWRHVRHDPARQADPAETYPVTVEFVNDVIDTINRPRQFFKRECIQTHCSGQEWPEFLGEVQLGEPFTIETERFNLANGPLAIRGVQTGDDLAIHIERIEIFPPYFAPNGGPFFEGMGEPVPLEYEDGCFIFPNHFCLPARPSVGNIAVLPEPSPFTLEMARTDPLQRGWRRVVNDPRGKHCHQDCPFLREGAILHIKAQVDGAGLCAADVHAYLGQGETAFAGIEVNASLRLRVERSQGWLVDWPLIETGEEIMLFCSDTNLLDGAQDQTYVDVVRESYRAMRAVVAERAGVSIVEANAIVATALDIRNCAIYGMGNFIQKEGKTPQPDKDIAILACLPKEVFG